MKKALVSILAIALLSLAACAAAPETDNLDNEIDQTPPQVEPSTDVDAEADETPSENGFYITRPEKLPLQLETPDAWVYVDPSENDLAKLTELLGDAGVAETILQQVKDSDVVFFYDTAHYSGDFRTNLNITKQSANNIKQNQLAGLVPDIKASCERDFSQVPFENFSWVMEPQGKTLGDNYYVVFIANYAMGTAITGVMAYTIYGDSLYQFTYSVPQDLYNDEFLADFEKVLSSVKFG
ncbi:MAG: hypothetical protein FWG24_00115 [Eggerthellaceae bacterium]|nr:hypothetical protein [Eggerthellaceae bacterium]